MCQLPLNGPISVYVDRRRGGKGHEGRLTRRVEAIMRPAMDRKIFSAFAPLKNFMRANMNDSFKKGLRNALTGLYVWSF